VVRVAFLGPAGTFTEEALRASAADVVGASYEAVPLPTVYETVMAVHNRDADRAVVPIENSLEGGVTATLDTLAGEAEDVRIAAEVIRPVSHCLIARSEVALSELRRVVSHPQALAQCARFLRARLPGAERTAAASTAEAVRQVAATDGPEGAIGPRLAAELYGCRVLAEGIEDEAGNLTRFVWLAPAAEAAGASPPSGTASKTSVVFWGFSDESPGALVALLSEFSQRDINLTRIESRPRRVRLGHYMFFADLEGGAEEPPVRDALEALGAHVQTVRVLGSYPAAQA
jgi:prephenate dehydratase